MVRVRCDTCGGYVEAKNNVLVFEVIVSRVRRLGPNYKEEEANRHDMIHACASYSRHLVPVAGKFGGIVCPGCPTRTQYLEGYPHVFRPYLKEDEAIFRRARQIQLERADDSFQLVLFEWE